MDDELAHFAVDGAFSTTSFSSATPSAALSLAASLSAAVAAAAAAASSASSTSSSSSSLSSSSSSSSAIPGGTQAEISVTDSDIFHHIQDDGAMNANIQVADQLISKLVDEDVLKRTDERIRALLYSDPLIMATLQEPRAQRNTSVYKLRDPMLNKLRQNNELSGELSHILTIIMDHLRVQMEADVDECFTLPAEKDLDE